MVSGRVKWLDDNKGYGYIKREKGGDVFVHYSDIQEEGFRILEPGQEVIFDIIRGKKGPQAVNVVAV